MNKESVLKTIRSIQIRANSGIAGETGWFAIDDVGLYNMVNKEDL